MRSFALKKLRLNCKAGVSPQTAKQQDELVLIERGCQGQSKDTFVQKERRAAETNACHTCGRRLATHANEHRDSKYFDTIFDKLMGTPEIHDSGARDIERSATDSVPVCASRGEEGVHLILANPPWRQLPRARRKDFRETRSTVEEHPLTESLRRAVQYSTDAQTVTFVFPLHR